MAKPEEYRYIEFEKILDEIHPVAPSPPTKRPLEPGEKLHYCDEWNEVEWYKKAVDQKKVELIEKIRKLASNAPKESGVTRTLIYGRLRRLKKHKSMLPTKCRFLDGHKVTK